MDKNDIKVSFTILTHNETDELKLLLNQIKTFKTLWDEVIIVDDFSTNSITNDILADRTDSALQAKVFHRKLDGDFASQKNYADSECKNDYIFNIDADELLDENLCKTFREILMINPDVEYFRLPRINKVEGITLNHINNWHWQISSLPAEIETDKSLTLESEEFKLLKAFNLIISNDNGLFKHYTPIINWPDQQGRIYKKLPNISWQNKVHEVISGYKKYANFPVDKKFSIHHYKKIGKQEEQNNFYSNIR